MPGEPRATRAGTGGPDSCRAWQQTRAVASGFAAAMPRRTSGTPGPGVSTSVPLPLQPVLSAARLCPQSSPFPRASLSPFGSEHWKHPGCRDPRAWLAPLPAPVLARQSGCHGQVFCKRQISAAPGIVSGRGRQGEALPAVQEGRLAGSQCLALGELLHVGRDECAWL